MRALFYILFLCSFFSGRGQRSLQAYIVEAETAEGMPCLAPKGLAIDDLRELSRSDFLESLLWIREDGWFFRE